MDEDLNMSVGEMALSGPARVSAEDEESLLDVLALAQKEISDAKTVDIPIPSYGKSGVQLYVRYRLMHGDETAAIGRRVSNEFPKEQQYERQLYASVDVMVEACEGFLVQRGGRMGEKQLVTINGQVIRGYNEDLARALKFIDKLPNTSGRSVLFAFFGNNEHAIQQHSIMLARWMGDTALDVEEEFFGILGNR